MLDPYEIILRDGKKVDRLTDAAMKRAEARLGRKIAVTQGSYNPGGVAASAGAHDLGGVVDCSAFEWQAAVAAMRAVGFAAWYRKATPGLWPAHIHAVLIGHGRLSPVAARQVPLYLNRRDGLVSNFADTDPGWTNTARYTVEAFKADEKRGVLTERIAADRSTIARLKARVKRLLARRAAL